MATMYVSEYEESKIGYDDLGPPKAGNIDSEMYQFRENVGSFLLNGFNHTHTHSRGSFHSTVVNRDGITDSLSDRWKQIYKSRLHG